VDPEHRARVRVDDVSGCYVKRLVRPEPAPRAEGERESLLGVGRGVKEVVSLRTNS
jgi:hypothetical protein